MKRGHRSAHKWIWLVLAPVILALFFLGLIASFTDRTPENKLPDTLIQIEERSA